MSYITLKQRAQATIIEKKSRFVADVCPVCTEKEAQDFIASIRAQDRTATHNVYAYRLRENNLSRFTDAGEPSGTAGMPVLNVLERGGITDAVIVVTRWFGGTLLGTGGLVRAYGGAAKLGVEASGLVQMVLAGRYAFRCSYADYEKVLRLAADCGVEVKETVFEADVYMEFVAQSAPAQQLDAALRELTRGQSSLTLLQTGYLPMDFSAEEKE